ncbi:MAG: hypothetical protein AB1486_32210 [Planctomycetota bacterium]
MALVGLRPNRSLRAAAVLIPALALGSSSMLLSTLLDGRAETAGQFEIILTSIAVGFSALALLAPALQSLRTPGRYAVAMAVALAAVGLTACAYSGDPREVAFLIAPAMAVGLVVTAGALAACVPLLRGSSLGLRFTLWLFGSSLAAMLALGVLSGSIELLGLLLLQALLISLACWLLVLPFVLLARLSPLYGERLRSLFAPT